MTRIGAVMSILIALTATAPATAYEQKIEAPEVPELRVVLGPEQSLATNGYVGGQLVMRIQLISRYPFEALDLKTPQIAGARMVVLLRPRTRKVTSYAGEGYVFETAIAILPSSSGVLTVPSVTAAGMVEPEKDVELTFDLASEPTNVKIAGIPPSFTGDWWLATHRVEIEETWSTPPDEIRVGQSVRRSVSLRAWGVTETQLPEMTHRQTNGLHVSLASMRTGTELSPDGLIATADYTWDILIDPLQVAFIAPLGITYWHPIEHRQLRAGVPALRIEPLPADGDGIAERAMQEAHRNQGRMNLLILVLAGIFSLPVAAFGIAYLMTVLPTRSDLRLVRASRNASSTAARYRSLTAWLGENRWSEKEFDQHHVVRKLLSDQLFARNGTTNPVAVSIAGQALAFSRRKRGAALVDLLLGLLGSTRRRIRL